MALAKAWWMKELQKTPTPSTDPDNPHLAWPWNQPTVGISFHTLETYLINHQRYTACLVHKFSYHDGQWSYVGNFGLTKDLIHELRSRDSNPASSTIFVVVKKCPEVIQALGHYLQITPRFFNFPYVPLSTGNQVSDYAFFNLQFMDMYLQGTAPEESTRVQNPPCVQFDIGNGLEPHTWRVTRVSLIYWIYKDTKALPSNADRGMGLILLDPADVIIFEGLRKLMTRNETIPPGSWERRFGLGQVLSEMFHIVSHTWSVFVGEAELHLQNISRTVSSTRTTHQQQKSLSLALHQLSPLWSEVRRRIISAKDAAKQMIAHPFFVACDGVESIDSYLNKMMSTFEDLEKRTDELDTMTNILINLIFNLATFTDTAAAIQETKAANDLARSIRRVALLTFFYLPLQISASIYGMNVREITGNDEEHRIWQYVVLSLSLMAVTSFVWYAWSKIPAARISRYLRTIH